MKALFFTYLLLILCINIYSQTSEEVRVKGDEVAGFIMKEQYKYPAFMRSRVYLNNGDSAGGMFNYNYFLQSMQFISQTGDTLVISNEKDIKYITTGTDTFFYDNGFYEWVASSATAKLVVKRSVKSTAPQKLGAFGIPTATNKIESQDELRNLNIQKLDIMEEIVFNKQRIYYLSKTKNHFIEANKKNISKFFPKKDIDNYIKDKKLNLTKEKDLVQLFVFANTPV